MFFYLPVAIVSPTAASHPHSHEGQKLFDVNEFGDALRAQTYYGGRAHLATNLALLISRSKRFPQFAQAW